MSSYISTKEIAATIRARLKEECGWNQSDVSIKTKYFSGGSSVYATIRSAKVRTSKLRKILETGERIHRCEYSGDILSGANRFVHVCYTDELRAVLARRHSAALADAVEKLRVISRPGISVQVEGTNAYGVDQSALVGFAYCRVGLDYSLWVEGRPGLTVRICDERSLVDAACELALALERAQDEREEVKP